MKKASIFLFLFFIVLCTYGQKGNYYREINWSNPKTVSHYYNIDQKQINKSTFLYFEGANYYNQQDFLPYYYELIKISSNNAGLKISNVKYEVLSTNELSVLKNKSDIPDKLLYEYDIKYSRKRPYLQLNLLPVVKNQQNGKIEKVVSFNIEIIPQLSKAAIMDNNNAKFSSESVLKNGSWVKIRLNAEGVYSLLYSEIIAMGFTNPESIKIYGNSSGMLPVSNAEPYQDDLIQNAIYLEKGSDGIFNDGDYILFYAKGPDQWTYDTLNSFYTKTNHLYSEYNHFYLTTDIGLLNTVATIADPAGAAVQTETEFTDFIHHEIDEKNLLESGQLWFGENFDINTSQNFDFNIPDLKIPSTLRIKASLAARSSANSSFNVSAGNQSIANVDIPLVNLSTYTATYAHTGIAEGDFSSSNEAFSININYNKPSSSSEGWLDYITINAQRHLIMSSGQLLFRYYNSDPASKIIEFQIQNTNSTTKVWNVTDPTQVQNLVLTSIAGNTISVKVLLNPGLSEFIAFNNNSFLSTELVGNVENQNLHSIGHTDMIIISHPDFLTQANEIASIHSTNDDLLVEVVTLEQIYNEFSSGTSDAAAIRNFIRMIYNRPTATDTLKYVLFIGDGSYDHKSLTANNINYVLTYQSKNSLAPTQSFVTDDFFGLLDLTDNVSASNSGLVDIGIGRLPVNSEMEAQQMVDKIKSYLNFQNRGSWVNTICFVGDDEDNNLHMRDADRLAKLLDTTYAHFFINKIFLDAFPQESSSISESYPEVNRLINDEINNGVLIFNYTGHGGNSGLAHERILTIDNINSWVNFDKLAIFMTATCEFSRFDNHKNTSPGELVLLNPNGGGIALLSTTRLVYSSPNFTINRNFYNYVFEKDDAGNPRALGDIIRLAKNASGTENNKRNFTLLGDPALKIPLPEYNVATDSINNYYVNHYTDTLKALTKVTIHGHIDDGSKSVVSDYNGIVFPLVLDKKQTIKTLANDGGLTMDFQVQDNILYKGRASVTNGRFEYSFVVPKDISYSFDKGKISYYSFSSDTDAKGEFSDFIIGGSNDNADTDNIGPDVKLYMNDENFVSGGITNENPNLYVVLKDSSGINTVGNGIGHDITAILDNNSANPIVLNDYYESNLDNYQEGTIEYLFSELDEGNHNIKLKVWDVYNNSSEKQLDFIVAESESIAIKNLFNYPNPFTDQTSFFFDHNRPNEDLDVLIQIFTISGKIIKTINQIINTNAFRSEPIKWDGLDDFGDRIGRGVYVYQIKVRTVDGETVKKVEKLVILK